MIEDWRNATDSVRAFLTEFPFKSKSGTLAFANYQSFCRDCGTSHPLHRNNFYLELEKHGYSRKMDPSTKTLSFTNDKVEHDTPYRDSFDDAVDQASDDQPVYDDDVDSL